MVCGGNMENKEEVIEELHESTSDETITFEPVNQEKQNEVEEQYIDYGFSTKKKIGIVILVFLLILDIAALVIYIIGIDKVLSFIK